MTTTAESWPWSPFSGPANVPSQIAVPSGVPEQLLDRLSREICFGQEPECPALVDQIGIVVDRVHRDEDHVGPDAEPGEPPGELEPAVFAEVHVDENDVRRELGHAPKTLPGRRGDANHVESLPFEQPARGGEERSAVIDDEIAQPHLPAGSHSAWVGALQVAGIRKLQLAAIQRLALAAMTAGGRREMVCRH